MGILDLEAESINVPLSALHSLWLAVYFESKLVLAVVHFVVLLRDLATKNFH